MIELTGDDLTIDEVVQCAREKEEIAISDEALEKVAESRAVLEQKVEEGNTYYGINTGFGALANEAISPDAILQMQKNQIRSHAFGAGSPMAEDEVRAMILIKLNSLACGHSGVRVDVIEMLRDLLNEEIYPRVPRKGSAGASGDLAPLSHMALVVMGEGKARSDKEWKPANQVLDSAGIDPLTLTMKEGTALINSTSFMAGLGSLAVHDAKILVNAADTTGGITLEAERGVSDPFTPELHALRGHEGQQEAAENIRSVFEGSELVCPSSESHKVQDPYSLRCMPQVHGATRDIIENVSDIITREINGVTDNPLILDDGRIVSGGNFHGQPVAVALDWLALGVSELGSISERRIFNLVAGESGDNVEDPLPAFLVEGENPGLNSGFMIPQVTAASLSSENKTLASPSSIDNVPTSDNQEDHVSMGANGANHLTSVIENVYTIIGTELFASYQALNHRNGNPGKKTSEIESLIAERVDPLEQDRFMVDDLETIMDLIKDGAIV